MIAWSIDAAQKSRYVSRIVLSSDDDEIIAAAEAAGCEAPFKRPLYLADDATTIEPVVIHALDSVDETFDYVVLLQPTSPLRIADDIDDCIERCLATASPACVAVTKPSKPPQWMFTLSANGEMTPVLPEVLKKRRQEIAPAYVINGACYVANCDWFRKSKAFLTDETVAHIMPQERSIDIDTELDFLIAESIKNHS